MARSLRVTFVLLAVTAASGCGLFGGAGADALDDAHVVWITQTECPHLVVKTTRGERFGLVTPLDPYVPRRGDVLEGSLRPGSVRLDLTPLVPLPQRQSLTFEVTGAGLDFQQMQDAWRVVCPIVAQQPGVDPPPLGDVPPPPEP